MKKCLLAGLLLVLALALAGCGGSGIRVEADGSGDYATLAEAVANAPAGSVIILGAGTHRLAAPLEISQTLTLVGAGMDETEVVFDGAGYVLYFTGTGVLTAQDLTFRHEGEQPADVLDADSGQVHLTRCRFSGAVVSPYTGLSAGIRLRGSASGSVRDCQVTDNSNSGILLEDSAQFTLEGNTTTANEVVGIAFLDRTGGTARQNNCSQNGVGGILVAGAAAPLLEQNRCNDNGDVGIAYFEGGGGAARQNECRGNGHYGLFIDLRSSPEVVNNDCEIND